MTPENVKAFRLRALIKIGGPEAVAAELRKIVRQIEDNAGINNQPLGGEPKLPSTPGRTGVHSRSIINSLKKFWRTDHDDQQSQRTGSCR
jgi:hypothetical protein